MSKQRIERFEMASMDVKIEIEEAFELLKERAPDLDKPHPEPRHLEAYKPSNIAQARVLCSDAMGMFAVTRGVDGAAYSWDEVNKDVSSSNADLLATVAKVEDFMSVLCDVFDFKTRSGVVLSKFYKGGEGRTSLALTTLGCMIEITKSLVDHPAVIILTTLAGVEANSKPFVAMRDLRWIFNPNNDDITLEGQEKFFDEVGRLLVKIGFDAYQSVKTKGKGSELLNATYQDFIGYVYDDELEEFLITPLSLGTAITLCVNLCETAVRFRKM